MEVILDIRKSIPDNAKVYYEKAKKAKGKIEGMKKAIEDTSRKIEESEIRTAPKPKITIKKERRWFEKFRWFVSSDGFLVLGGRDATSNEVLIKKHTQEPDSVMHANIQGAPFFTIKNEKGMEIPEKTRLEAAQAAASYSKAWNKGYGSIDVYEINPAQVSKTPPAGEYLPKGAFMIYGEKKWLKNTPLSIAIGVADEEIIGGPLTAIESQTKKFVKVGLGDISQGNMAKKIRLVLKSGEIDDIQRFLPAGDSQII